MQNLSLKEKQGRDKLQNSMCGDWGRTGGNGDGQVAGKGWKLLAGNSFLENSSVAFPSELYFLPYPIGTHCRILL